ncbi:acyltransferase [Alteromonas sp. KUL17]|nr:acyltransferase [Alteromonas sp. KUL17]
MEFFMRFIGLDGLRGLMCLWVVVGHTVTMAGFNLNESQLSTKLLGQGLAVELFFIISGFVITLMFMNKNLPFKKYLSQRILRIFPVYLLFLLITAAMLPIALYVLQNFPVEIEKTASRLAFTEVSINDFVKHFIPHLLMAHGLIPNAILDKTAYTIMGQAWSLTLQFQFFIIAPFLFVCFRKNQVIFYALILMALCVEPVFKATMGHGSFILANSKMFIVGILSAILLNHKVSAKISHKNFAIALFFCLLYCFSING